MKKVFKTMAFTLLGLVLSVNLMAATAGDVFSKITSISDLADGDEIIFVNQAETYACGTTQNNNNRSLVSITTKSSKYTYASEDNVQVFVVKKNTDGKFGFHTGSGYIYSASSSSNYLRTNSTAATTAPSGTAAWTLSITNSEVSAMNVSNTSYYLACNGTTIFSQYKTGQSKPYIYKKQSSTPTEPTAPSITTQPEDATYEQNETATPLSVVVTGNPDPELQWYSNTTKSTSGASAIANATNASYTPSTATIGTKYYYCVATNTQGSATSDIVAVTVTAALPKITITDAQVADFTNSYKEYTWTVSDISGKMYAYKTNGMQFNVSQDGYYVCNTDPIPGNIRSIKMTTHNSGTERDWDVWVSAEPITSEVGEEVQLDKKNVAKTGTTWEVSGSYQYFYLQENASKGASNISEIVITYEELAPTNEAITFAAPEGGSLVIKNGATPIATGAAIQDGTILDVTFGMTPAEAYKDVAIKVTKTDGGDDVTSTVYDATKKQITMPRYAITVAVTFTKLYKIEAATVTGGTLSWEDENKEKPTYVEAETLIQALQEEATHYEFKSFDIYKTEDATAKVTNEGGLFEMPAYDVTISGIFEEMQCTALPSAPVLVTPTISYAEGVTLNWTKLDAASGYIVNVWKGTDKIVVDEMITDVNTISYKITAPMDVNTEYSYSIAGIGDDETYCMIGNPANESTFTTADYPAATLTLSENGGERTYGENLKVNSQVTLPSCDVTCDKKFVGWSTSNAEPSNLMAAGSEYTLTSTAVTLYAWFATETPGSEQTVFSENFNACDGTGANDDNGWNGNSIAGKDMPSSITGWTFENAKAAYQCAKFGTSSKKGSAQTPALNCTGDGVLTFKAGAWDANDEVTGLTISATEGVSLKDAEGNAISSVTMTKGAWTSYTIYVYGMQTSSKITFAASQASKNRFFLDEVVLKQAGAPSYSDYSLTCSAKANAPVFDLEEGTYTMAKELNITAEDGATIYYTLDGTEPDNTKTLYEGAISLDTYGKVTVKAIAYVAEKDPSDVVTKEYMMNLPFTSLEQLVAANVQSGTEITITFPKTQIKSLAGTKGVYFNIQKEGKDIEIYAGENRPDNYEAGGYLKTTKSLTCAWKRYEDKGNFQCWELTPSDWSAFEYSDPDPFTSVADLYAAGLTDGSKVYLNITNAYVHAKSAVSTNYFTFIQDGGVGIVLRTSETIADENIGKLMTAKIVGNLAYSNGRPQIAVSSLSEVSYTNGDRPTAKTTTLSAGEEATQILSLVKFDGFYAQSQDKTAKTAIITENADGTGASYSIYNLFNALKTVPESDKAINVKGLFYKKVESNVTSYSIVPVLVEDVALVTPADAPAASVNKGSEDDTNPTEVGNGEIITITPAAGFTASYILNDAAEKTITASEEKVTMTANSTLIIKSSRDYYTTTSKTYYYKINEALTYHSITKPIGNYTCELSAASAKQGDHVTITFTMNDHWYLDGVTVKNAADETETFAATKESDNVYGFDMPAYDVKLSTSTHGDPKYSITYQKGGIQAQGEDITEAAQYEGTVLTLKECTWTSDNYVFKGWKAQYNDGEKDVELPITNNTITVPAYDVKIIAQWNKIASYDWVLVTDVDQLAAGDYVVIASNAKGKVASNTITSQYMEEITATFSAEKDYLNSVPTGAAVLTLGGEAGAWTLTNKDGNVLGATAEKKLAWGSGTQTWSISIDADNNAIIQNGTSSYGRFLHNVNSNRFTTYSSNTSNIMLLPQLYMAKEHTYVVKYNLNGGANKPADSHADADGKVTITTDVPTYTGYKFLGWNSVKEGTGDWYYSGQECTIEDDITIYAQWQEVSKYTVTYIANGATGSVPTETDKYEASKFSVKGQGELEYPDYIFRGWSDGENIYQEGDEYAMPNHAVEFTAQWESALDTHWALVLDINQLQDGDKVIIAAANSDKALGAESDNNQYRQQVDVKKSTNKFYLSELQTIPTELTLGIVNGNYTFNDGDGYLYAAGYATSKQNYLGVEEELEEGIWNITIEDGVASITSTVNEFVPIMSYNSSATRFSCYTQIQGQGTLAIYKYYEYLPTFETRVVTPGKVGTVCYDNTILAVEGGTLYQPNYKDDAVKNIYFSEPDAYTAGLPMIFQADAEELVLVVSADPETQVDEPISDMETTRGMVGDLDEDNRLVPSGMYIFTQNKLWIVDQNCYVDKNRAYVDLNYVPFSDGELSHELPNGAPRKTICLGNASPATPTNLNGLKGNVKAMKVMQDGQFYIIRDAKIFNAQGIKVQ